MVAMIFVPDVAEREQRDRDEVQEKILAALTNLPGPTGPTDRGIKAADLQGATGASVEVFEPALRQLTDEGRVIARKEFVYDEKGRVAGVETVYASGRRDAVAMPETIAANSGIGPGTGGDEQPNPEATDHNGLPIRFDAPDDAELEITLEREEFHPFEWKAILLEAKISIRNLTTKMKYTQGTMWHIDPPEDGQSADWHGIEVLRAREALKKKRSPELHSTVAPADTVAGWVYMSLPHQPWGGVGGFTIIIEDEVGTQYVLRRERRGGRKPLNS